MSFVIIMCVCVCVRNCMRVCVRGCMRACARACDSCWHIENVRNDTIKTEETIKPITPTYTFSVWIRIINNTVIVL